MAANFTESGEPELVEDQKGLEPETDPGYMADVGSDNSSDSDSSSDSESTKSDSSNDSKSKKPIPSNYYNSSASDSSNESKSNDSESTSHISLDSEIAPYNEGTDIFDD